MDNKRLVEAIQNADLYDQIYLRVHERVPAIDVERGLKTLQQYANKGKLAQYTFDSESGSIVISKRVLYQTDDAEVIARKTAGFVSEVKTVAVPDYTLTLVEVKDQWHLQLHGGNDPLVEDFRSLAGSAVLPTQIIEQEDAIVLVMHSQNQADVLTFAEVVADILAAELAF